MNEEDIVLISGAGWKWVCPICNNPTEYTNVISTDFEIVKSFKETHMKKHAVNKEWKKKNK